MSNYDQSLIQEIQDLYNQGVGIGYLNKAYDQSMVNRALPPKIKQTQRRQKKSRRHQVYV